jgi:hypothetical protein
MTKPARRNSGLTCERCGGDLYSFCPRCRGQVGGILGGIATGSLKTLAAQKANRARWRKRRKASS